MSTPVNPYLLFDDRACYHSPSNMSPKRTRVPKGTLCVYCHQNEATMYIMKQPSCDVCAMKGWQAAVKETIE